MRAEDFFEELAREDDEFRAERELASTALDLARNLHRLRMGMGWSQERLADEAGTSQPRIAELEAGAGNPTLRTLTKLAGALGARVDELVAPLEVRAAEDWDESAQTARDESVSVIAVMRTYASEGARVARLLCGEMSGDILGAELVEDRFLIASSFSTLLPGAEGYSQGPSLRRFLAHPIRATEVAPRPREEVA